MNEEEILGHTSLGKKLHRVLGYIPIGTSDLLKVLTHPDVIDETEAYIQIRKEIMNGSVD